MFALYLGGVLLRFRLITFCLLLLLILTACNSSAQEKSKDTNINIYTSIYPLQFITEQIARETATVKSIYPPGVDAHSYEPTMREITNMAHSDAFIYLGSNMESFTEAIVQALRSHEINFIEIGEHEELFMDGNKLDHHGHSDLDPHIWLDPLRMIDMATIIKDELIHLTPQHKEMFEENFQRLKKELKNLDDAFLETIHPKKDKQIIVAHAAYGYWEERYGIQQIPISGVTAGNEPSQKELAQIVKLARDKNVQYVIYEQNSSDRLSTIIQEYLEADALYLHNLEVLTDEDVQMHEDYFSLMKKNLHVLDQATK